EVIAWGWGRGVAGAGATSVLIGARDGTGVHVDSASRRGLDSLRLGPPLELTLERLRCLSGGAAQWVDVVMRHVQPHLGNECQNQEERKHDRRSAQADACP